MSTTKKRFTSRPYPKFSFVLELCFIVGDVSREVREAPRRVYKILYVLVGFNSINLYIPLCFYFGNCSLDCLLNCLLNPRGITSAWTMYFVLLMCHLLGTSYAPYSRQ